MGDVSREFVSGNPGRDVQRVGTARFLGEDVAKVHDPVWGVIGTLGDSQCYLGVRSKVDAVHEALAQRIHDDDLPVRLIAPAFTLGVSDGQLNGTDRMRYSLTSRELVNDSTEAHLKANDMSGVVAVVACDKPPVGTLAALLEHNAPALMLSDGSIHPGLDPVTGERIDLVTAFQYAADPDPEVRARLALHACPGQGSCGGMFTYNTMQTFIGVLGMEPLHMVAPASDDARRTKSFPDELAALLATITAAGIRPRDIVTPAAMRNAFVVVMAMGGSTNVVLHGPEIARAAGFDLWDDVLSQQEFNELSHRLPVLVNMRPFGEYSMVDVDAIGGVAVIVKELLAAGELDGSALTCTGETLAEQVERLDPPAPDGEVVLPVSTPFKHDRRSPPPAGQPRARRRRHPEGGGRRAGHRRWAVHRPRARVRGRALADRRARGRPGVVRRRRHRHRPVRRPPRRPGHARDARPDVAHHRAVPCPRHHGRAHDRRSVLGRIGRARHRPRVARGVPRRPDRAGRRRRHDPRRPQRRPLRLSSSSTTPTPTRGARGAGRRRSPRTAGSTPTRRWSAAGC